MAYAAGDSHPFIIYGANNRIGIAVLDATGEPATPTTPDTELSVDEGNWADATNEYTQATGGVGVGYIDLTGAECSASKINGVVKSADQMTTPFTLYPVRLSIYQSDTAEGGGASTITLAVATANSANSFYNGCWVLITNNSPAGVQYACRRVLSYVGSTRVATVDSAWGTNPDNTTTYSILLPPAANVVTVAGANPSTTIPAGAITADSIATDALTQAKFSQIVRGTVDNGSFTTTETEFESDDITTAAADHWNGRVVIFTSGTLAGQARAITDYAKVGSNGHFTIDAATSVPANDVTFIIV